jgi:predicted nucleotidyltransferase
MSKYQQIINSFSIRKTLNPKIWENPDNPNNATMIPKVRKALELIADKFVEYLGDDVFVEDVVLTGSLANFNWSEYSDFDLHVIVDMDEYGDDDELYKELFNLKKQLFNDKHNIRIFKYDVELYAQDMEEPHTSSGVYSVMKNEWVNVPKKMNLNIDKKVLETKIQNWTEKIDNVINGGEVKKIEIVKDKLKKYRKSGLDSEGELSYENLVFKYLRRSGHIERLFDSSNKGTDKELSIERKIED